MSGSRLLTLQVPGYNHGVDETVGAPAREEGSPPASFSRSLSQVPLRCADWGAQSWASSEPVTSQPCEGLRTVWSVLLIIILAAESHTELYKRAKTLSESGQCRPGALPPPISRCPGRCCAKCKPDLAQTVENLPAMQEQVQSLGRGDPLGEGTAAHSSILAWRIPRTEEPGGLQSMAHMTERLTLDSTS